MAPLRRRTVLRLAGAAAVAGTAGCLGNSPGQSEDDDSDPAGDPGNETENGDDAVFDPEPDIPACPEKPDSLTEETVADYATRLEEAREIRQTFSGATGNVTHISANTSDVNATEVGDGWKVRFHAETASVRMEDGSHGDPAIRPVAYFVNDTTVRRAVVQERFNETLHPREEGEVFECPPA